MKKKISILLLLIVLVGALIACVACKSKTVPVYQGMTIVRQKDAYAVAEFATQLYANNGNNIGWGWGNEGKKPNNGEFVPADNDGEIEKNVEDIVTIEVESDDTVKYYVKPNETFIVQVHISNPDDYEIQSFTLNGQKYANYMFRQGSTMGLLLLEVQAPATSGYFDLTIDAIKYIDGTEIKDVRMDGSKTIKAGVAYEHEPTATVTSKNIDTTKATFTFNVTDTQDIIGKNAITAYLTDGDKNIAEKVLEVGSNTVTFDNLTMGKTYQYGIATSYDLIDRHGVKAHWLLSDTFSTLKAFAITNGIAKQDSVTFKIEKTGTVGNITSVKLFDYDNGELVNTLTGTVAYKFDNLLSNHAYLIEVNFDYEVNGSTVSDSTKMMFTTLAKTAPTVAIQNVTSTQTRLDFELAITDVSGILDINAVELLNGETVVKTLDKTSTTFKVNELTTGTMYTIKVTYTYDLNDGDGVHTEYATTNYPTLVESVTVTKVSLVNTNQVRLGEELNLRVDFDNPNNIQLTSIYVNGQKVQVSGGDRKTYAIVRFATTESGLIDFYVDRVDYKFTDVEVNQHVDSLAHVTFPVFTDLDIKFETVSASPYEYTGNGIYFYFDNPQDYKVYKVNDSNDFVQISNNEFYINFGKSYYHRLTSIEYGYDNYGTTTQALNYPSNSWYEYYYYSIEKYLPVFTTDDLLNMSGHNYYILMNDLDMRDVNISQSISLIGYLNGNGHTIRGLHNVIDTSSQNYFDIFQDGSIFDTNFIELYFSIVNSKAEKQSISLFGNTRLYNCTVSGDFNASGNVNFGGITQYNDSNTFNLNTTINNVDVSDTTTKDGVKIKTNNALEITDDVIYYHCGDSTTLLLGCYNKDITQLTIRDDTVKIWADAFAGCSNLISVTFGSSVTTIGYSSFSGCINLTSVYYTGDIASWCSIGFENGSSNPLNNDAKLYIDNELVTELVIPDTVTEIKKYAFCGCASIKNVIISDSVMSIGTEAFYECGRLENIVIGKYVKTISSYAFNHCYSLENVYFKGVGFSENIDIESGNSSLSNAWYYFYSETEPELNDLGTGYTGAYWHYVDGVVTVWEKEN